MIFEKTNIEDLIVIEPKLIKDNRGWFSETYNNQLFKINGVNMMFVQDNHSFSLNKGSIAITFSKRT